MSKCLLRLTDLERQKLQLLVAALRVSEYTDDVDDFRRQSSREKRMAASMLELFDTITGLAIASDAVPKSIKDTLLVGNTGVLAVVPLLEEFFEIFRRYKRLNPFSHRNEYGKLVMLLQDVQKHSIRSELGIRTPLLVPLQVVEGALAQEKCTQLLSDPTLEGTFLRKRGRGKAEGLEVLVDTYAGLEDRGRRETVERSLRSMDDVCLFLQSNTEALAWLQSVLVTEFKPMSSSDKYNLAIRRGKDGACFTHDHATQCQYVMESLRLWEIVQRRIFDLWEAAEDDMLVNGEGRYNFCNTGQGFHRMCRSPKSYSFMSQCVQDAEQQMGGWVGIKVIHLGDRDVPNPLVFIDKYTIIPRIVQPVVHAVNALRDAFAEETSVDVNCGTREDYPGLRNFLKAKYKSYEDLRLHILSDFFKHAFDGSGDDGGTCIDGRLTSAWNWCHQLDKKSYYDAFILTGFNGFD